MFNLPDPVLESEVKLVTPEVSPYDSVIADLEAKRDQLVLMIESLRQMKSFAQSLPTSGGSAPTPKALDSEIAHDAFFGMNISEAARKLLQIRKKTLPHPELCDALLNGGLKSSATNFRETARGALGRSPEFVKVNSEWGLVEWYPGLRREPKRKRPQQASGDAAEGGDMENDQETEDTTDSAISKPSLTLAPPISA